MDQIIQLISSLIITVIDKTGYFGIFLLMTAEAALIPIPSEITLPFSGYLATVGRFSISLVILFGVLGDLFGSFLTYWLGYWGEDLLVRNIIRKYGKYVLISEREFEKSEKWFRKYGQSIVFVGRLLPVVRTFISLPAGISKMNFWKFFFFTLAGVTIWATLLSYIGFYLGKNWNSLHVYYQRFEIFIVAALVVIGVYYIYHKIKSLKS